tara:strand:+ start:916 stop:1413 length:498 start_codon:yes stop_codon:yes gene_type:complete
MFKNIFALLGILTLSNAVAAEVPIMGSVDSKCVVTTDTQGVYGNPTPNKLTTNLSNGGVPPVVRYDVIQADYYKAVISRPDEFTESPTLNDVVVWVGDVTVSEVSDAAMSAYDNNKIEYNNITEIDLTIAGSTWFKVASTANYGYDKAFPAGQYRAVVTAECIAI